METTVTCPNCGNTLFPTDLFCSRCGTKITSHQAIGIGKQIYIYTVSLLLPPLGLIWTWKYRNGTPQMKKIGYVAAGITVVAIILTVWATIGFFQGIQSQLNSYSQLGI